MVAACHFRIGCNQTIRTQVTRVAKREMAQSYDNNAAAVRATSFAFDIKAAGLEIPQLQLTKTQATQNVAAKLSNVL